MKPTTYKPTRGVPETPPNLPALPKAKQQRRAVLTQAAAQAINAKADAILSSKGKK